MSGSLSAVANIGALQAETTTTLPGGQCYVLGYDTSADGGEGAFIYVSTDTTSADNGGTIIVDTSGRRWYRADAGAAAFNVRWFGAVGTNSATTPFNNTIKAAIAAGVAVYVPGGTYVVSDLTTIGPKANLSIFGDGRYQSIIETDSATATVLTFGGFWLSVRDIHFTSSVTRTAGAYINITTGSHEFTRCLFDGYYQGVSGQASIGFIRDCTFTAGVAGAVGILVNGYSGGLVITDCYLYQNTASLRAGIEIVNSGDVQLIGTSAIGCGTGLLIDPSTGESVSAVWATNCFFDHSQSNGVAIIPSGTGGVSRCTFTQCWMSSSGTAGTGNGTEISQGSGSIAGVEFANCTMILNAGNGLVVYAATDIKVNGGLYAGNTASGVAVAGAAIGFTITGTAAGAYGGCSGNGVYGIQVAAVAANDYIISLNRTAGNTSAGVSDSGTGSTKYVSANIA